MSKNNNWKNSIYYLSDKEIVQYYGQIWENCDKNPSADDCFGFGN